MIHRVQVWNIKVTTVEQPGEDSDVPCDGCEAPCCKGIKIPLLTKDEFFSNKYPIRVIDIPELKRDVPNAENVIGLGVFQFGCPFLKNNRCLIYQERPKACRVYDCREDDEPGIKDFAQKRFKQNGTVDL